MCRLAVGVSFVVSKVIKRFLFISLLAFFGTANAETYNLDLTHSTIGFKIKHLGISTVSGRFNDFSGSANFDEKKPSISNMTVTIKVASIDTNVNKRDEHLRSADFFDVKKFPTMEFKASKFK